MTPSSTPTAVTDVRLICKTTKDMTNQPRPAIKKAHQGPPFAGQHREFACRTWEVLSLVFVVGGPVLWPTVCSDYDPSQGLLSRMRTRSGLQCELDEDTGLSPLGCGW